MAEPYSKFEANAVHVPDSYFNLSLLLIIIRLWSIWIPSLYTTRQWQDSAYGRVNS